MKSGSSFQFAILSVLFSIGKQGTQTNRNDFDQFWNDKYSCGLRFTGESLLKQYCLLAALSKFWNWEDKSIAFVCQLGWTESLRSFGGPIALKAALRAATWAVVWLRLQIKVTFRNRFASTKLLILKASTPQFQANAFTFHFGSFSVPFWLPPFKNQFGQIQTRSDKTAFCWQLKFHYWSAKFSTDTMVTASHQVHHTRSP